MIFTEDISSVHIASGMAQRRVLLPAVDVWGKRLFVDASRWMAGRNALTAYQSNGEPVWKPRKRGLSEVVYVRDNIAHVDTL